VLECSHRNASGLIFPTSGGKPKLNFLDDLKAVAKRANLNPESVWLHKFRATFATWSLCSGVDLGTLQQWLGHPCVISSHREPDRRSRK
jgi:integrase/recombinase XerD